MAYEKYVKQYTPRVTTAIQITNRIFSSFSAINDCSSIEISRDRLPMCDKEVEMGEYSIKYYLLKYFICIVNISYKSQINKEMILSLLFDLSYINLRLSFPSQWKNLV